jgi:hypothetical protein
MSTRLFDNSNLAGSLAPRLSGSLKMSSLSVPLPQRIERIDRRTSPGMQWGVDAADEGRVFFRGLCWSLAIEGAAAICIYGLWHLWSLTR